MTACRTLGIYLNVSRPYTPTDKAHIDRIFRTIREGLSKEFSGPFVKAFYETLKVTRAPIFAAVA
jgi:hypothetical protein